MEEQMKKQKKKIGIGYILVVLLLLLPAILGSALLVVDFVETPKFEVIDNTLEVTSFLYSKDISLENTTITLDNAPLNLQRDVGTSFGDTKKGSFTNKDTDQKAYVNMMQFGEQYIKIESDNEIAYVNLRTTEETANLFNQLESAIK